MPPAKKLRVVAENETPTPPPTLLEAVESGDVLAIMKAQRRIIAESLATASENTRPQYSNELNKLNSLIVAEEARRSIAEKDRSVVAQTPDEAWNGTGY